MSEAVCLLQDIAIMIVGMCAFFAFIAAVAILHDFIHIYLPRKHNLKILFKDIDVYLRSEREGSVHE